MNEKWSNGRENPLIHDRQKREREEDYSNVCREDFDEDFQLPINHRLTENLDTDNLEQASLDTQLTSSNVGYRLLQKMGWRGRGLGKNEQGIVEPIKAGMRDPKLGVGKQEEDDFFTAEENVQRRKLDIELEDSEEIAKKREVIAEREQKIQTEVKEIHKMHGSSNRDDRQKRELIRQEKEMAKFAQMADAQKRQKQQQQEPSTVVSLVADSSSSGSGNPVVVQDQRQTLKFGFSSKSGASNKMAGSSTIKKPKTVSKVPSIFGGDSDDES